MINSGDTESRFLGIIGSMSTMFCIWHGVTYDPELLIDSLATVIAAGIGIAFGSCVISVYERAQEEKDADLDAEVDRVITAARKRNKL